MKRSPLRDTLHGFHMDNDRLWLLHAPDGNTYAITEYNSELTGYDPRLNEIDPNVFHYSGNVYYITGRWVKDRGWRAEALEDRT